MPILMLAPLLAMLGVFGETFTTTQAQNEWFTVQVQYATRSRYKLENPVEVTIRNLSTAPLATVEVRFAKAYIDQFASATFTPQAAAITDQFYVVQLNNLQPTETRVVIVSLQGERYGHHRGVIVVADAGEPTQEVTTVLATWIFP